MKKARQGEKVEEPEEEEEEYYEEIDEEEEEEEEFVSKSSKKKSSSRHNENTADSRHKKPTQSTVNRHLSSNKTSADLEAVGAESGGKQDIRSAFMRASTTTKPKSEKKLDAAGDDDLADEIMQELTNRKTAPVKAAASASRPKPVTSIVTPSSRAHIPFAATNSPRINMNSATILSLSPAHKRKLSPSKSLSSDHQPRISKKIDLDDELMQQLFENDSNHHQHHQAANNETRSPAVAVVKSEPVVFELPLEAAAAHVKIEKVDHSEMVDDEEGENLELLSALTLEASNCSMLAKHLNLPTKQESVSNGSSSNADASMLSGVGTMSAEDVDLSMHIKNLDKTDKLLVYWLDAFEDQFNSNGTVYLFGKMPIVTRQAESTAPGQLSFVSICCIVKNVPKVR